MKTDKKLVAKTKLSSGLHINTNIESKTCRHTINLGNSNNSLRGNRIVPSDAVMVEALAAGERVGSEEEGEEEEEEEVVVVVEGEWVGAGTHALRSEVNNPPTKLDRSSGSHEKVLL